MNNKRLSKKRELQAAKDIGGRAHAGSGCFWNLKSDFSNDVLNFEDKFTHEDKYSIQYSIIKKIEKESLKIGKLSGLRFGFHGTGKNYVLIEGKHLTEISTNCIFSTQKNSILFKLEVLKILFNHNIFCKVTFEKYNKSYILMEWNYFVEKYKELIKGDF